MVCKTACSQCSQTGLPILFTRYGVAYNTTVQGMAALDTLKPTGQFKAQPGGVALQSAKYNVRMLRAGYLYIRLEAVGRLPEWLAFAVHPHGYLTTFDIEHPKEAANLAACSPGEWGANRSLVWIKDAKDVTQLNFMFHPNAIDPTHLKTVIGAAPDEYMQRFDVSGWANGSKTGPGTAVPDKDTSQWTVAEFKALGNEAVRDALEPQLHGLMGSNAIERAWGPFHKQVESFVFTDDIGRRTGEILADVEDPGMPYKAAHGPRLQNIAKFLDANGGAVVACEDAIGIAQELGHLQAEAQLGYTRWQSEKAAGAMDKDVTNEWVFQTAVGAQGFEELIKQGTIAKADSHAAATKRGQQQDKKYGSATFTDAELDGLHKQALERAQTAGAQAFTKYFNKAGSNAILAAQKVAHTAAQKDLAQLGVDQVTWLQSKGLRKEMGRYSKQQDKVDMPGGGAALTIQLAHCMAGCETNSKGLEMLKGMDPFGDNVLGRMISFNNAAYKQALEDFLKAVEASRHQGPAAEPGLTFFDNMTGVLKSYAGRLALGDKAIAFASDPKYKAFCESDAMRRAAWPLHIASLMSVKMMQSVNKLPATAAETAIVKYVALTGLPTMGKKTAAQLDQLTGAQRAKLATATSNAAPAMARVAVPEVRAAGLAAIFDLGLAIVKGFQLKAKPDQQTVIEMMGSALQGIGSLADLRAKILEETLYKGVKYRDLFRWKAALVGKEVNALGLKAARLTACKFLLPAALVGIYFDVTDALASGRRGDIALSIAQWSSVFGTAFTVGSTVMIATGTAFGFSVTAWAALFGLVGAVLIVVAVVGVAMLRPVEWTTWLKDNPLSLLPRKGGKPGHENLRETLQRLANAQKSLGGAEPAAAH